MDRRLFYGGVLSLISGTALWLSFPNFSFFPLAWVGLIPYLHFLLKKPPWGSVLLGHGVLTLVYFGGVLYWIPRVLTVYGNLSWLLALIAYALLLLLMSLFLLPFSLLTRWIAQRSVPLALLCAPGFWLLTELCRNYYAVNGFPWALLGYSQYPYSWIIQIVDLSGVYLLSLLVMAGNCALLGMFRLRSPKPLFLFGILFFSANLYGAYRLFVWQPTQGSVLKTALVQPNIGLSESREHYARKYFETLPDYYRQAAAAGAKWVIFPEAPNPFFYKEHFYFKTFWERQISMHGAYLLFNTTIVERDSPSRYFNSAVLLDAQGREAYRYDKTHLVPFGEYLPLESWLGFFFQPLVQEVAGFSSGEALRVGDISGTHFATLICYEGIFPELSRKFVQQGAEIFVNITNDSWYGRTAAPRQHFQMAVFRAIENRKPFLRCANSGYSAVIDHLGRTTRQLGLFEEGILMAEVAENTYCSIYSYTGEWLNIGIVGVTVLLALGAPFRKSARRTKKKRKKQKREKRNE
ncbi:apolipoprotein N-acyltransferase [Acidobacteria bacterium AH-259-O06]|nr:apolipoprotein N-acyltransferase [Acidobacteria bacterium AH-259-O06]